MVSCLEIPFLKDISQEKLSEEMVLDCVLIAVPTWRSLFMAGGRRKGTLVFWWSEDDHSWSEGDRNGFTLMFSFRGKPSTFDLVMVFGVLWFCGRRSES